MTTKSRPVTDVSAVSRDADSMPPPGSWTGILGIREDGRREFVAHIPGRISRKGQPSGVLPYYTLPPESEMAEVLKPLIKLVAEFVADDILRDLAAGKLEQSTGEDASSIPEAAAAVSGRKRRATKARAPRAR